MKRLLKTLILSLSILLAIVGGTFFWGYKQLVKPNNHSQEIITIETGMSRRAIVDLLAKQEIISSTWPLLVYLKLNPEKSKLQAGDYVFESPITPLEVIAKLNQGLVVTQQITIPEGYDKFDIIQVLTDAQIDSQKEIEKAIANIELIKDLDPEAKDLEGYLFPDTYTYTRQQKAPQLIAAMVRRFRQTLTPERQERIKARGMTLHQVITMASLVEKEAKINEERPTIAAVFYNRLKREMRLDCDPTFIYAAKVAKQWDGQVNNPLHRKRESPYNTYYITGLPVGPIASSGIKSIDAALYPSEVDYLYFVANGMDGRHNFSRTESEHLTAVAAYRRQKKQQNQGN